MKFFELPPALLALVATFILPSIAQYPLPASFQNVMQSPILPNISISYKQPPVGTCMTAFTTQKQYTGYISMPPFTLAPIQQNYSINYFFWFIEARQTPEIAPLTIYLNGGPGSSSMVGLFNEIGPCEVVQLNDGTYGTQARMWGWDRSSNILFLDQPNQVGFSYDTATNASFDIFAGQVYEPPTPPNPGLPSFMYLNGTFGTASYEDTTPWAATANTTQIAAQATWHFLQTWLSAFPQYNPAVRPNTTLLSNITDVPAGVNLFAESYGGKYGSAFAAYFEQQNQRRDNGSLPSNNTLAIQLESVGIISGMIDDLVQDRFWPLFAFNNTYGIQAISQTDELNSLFLFSGADGCESQILACRAEMESTDPDGFGDVSSTNKACSEAQITCNNIMGDYIGAGYYPYDIRQKFPSPDPPAAYQEYLNDAAVLSAIGAAVNYTESNSYVQAGYISTGDTIRGGMLDDLAYLLTNNVRVALIYGDADFICNWFGGEAVSLAIASLLPDYPPPTTIVGSTPLAAYSAAFPAAGYADIVVNSTYVGGAVRQYGNLSFSRIYDSGHFVPYFQPETAFTVFSRIIQGTEISTGDLIDLSTYSSNGTATANHTNSATYSPTPTCWVRAWNQSCSSDETNAMLAESGTIAYGQFFQDREDTGLALPSSAVAAGVPGHPATGTSSSTRGDALTGVYTATGTPSPSSGLASADRHPPPLHIRIWPLAVVVLCIVSGAALML